MEDPYSRLQETVQSLERHIQRARDMLEEEHAKASALLNSPEWASMTPKECARAIAEHEQRIRHAGKNLAQAERAQKQMKRRAKEYGP